MNIKRFLFLNLLLCSFLLLTGCDYFSSSLITLWTNRAEFAAYTEVFNTSQDKYTLEIIYKSQPELMLSGKEKLPDLIISEGLTNPVLADKFEPLNDLLKKDRIDPEGFYQTLLELCANQAKQRLLPVNFNLPAIIFKKQTLKKESANLMISMDYIKRESKAFNRKKRNNFNRMGFSPFWNSNFIYYTAILFGADFHASTDSEESFTWNEKILKETIDFFHAWIEEVNESFEKESTFTKKYINIPEYQLLKDDRILFYFTSIKSFLRIPLEKRKYLDFRLLSYNDKIPVMDDLLLTGILKKAKNKQGAKAFLKWFFQVNTQAKLLKVNHFKKLRGIFGLANGFSSLKEVNEQILHNPQYYPVLSGHIPGSDMLVFPKTLPGNWKNIKNDIIIPFLKDSITLREPLVNLKTRLKE